MSARARKTDSGKPVVFISHVHQHSGLSLALKTALGDLLLEGVRFFVSSDRSSIKGGDQWLERIEQALSECSIVLVLCDQESVSHPWINFEAGGG